MFKKIINSKLIIFLITVAIFSLAFLLLLPLPDQLLEANDKRQAFTAMLLAGVGFIFGLHFVNLILPLKEKKTKKIKIGLDLHGVISANPEFFSEISRLIIMNGGEVHILTGSHSNDIMDEVKKYGIKYTTLFSISDYHKSIGTPIKYDEKNTPWIDEGLWNRSKSEYAEREKLDFHFDDSGNYGQFFKTPYARMIISGYEHKKTPIEK